jgi:hypothetical protein
MILKIDNMKIRCIIFTIVLYCPIFIYSQNDTANKSITICSWKKPTSLGVDSLGQKQGYWENQDTCILIIKDRDNIKEFIETVYESGFYINNQKEGIWEVYPDIHRNPKQIIAHRLYLHGTVVYEIQYIRGKVHSILKYSHKSRVGSSTTDVGVLYLSELLLFNHWGRLIYRENISIDGVPEKHFYK